MNSIAYCRRTTTDRSFLDHPPDEPLPDASDTITADLGARTPIVPKADALSGAGERGSPGTPTRAVRTVVEPAS